MVAKRVLLYGGLRVILQMSYVFLIAAVHICTCCCWKIIFAFVGYYQTTCEISIHRGNARISSWGLTFWAIFWIYLWVYLIRFMYFVN